MWPLKVVPESGSYITQETISTAIPFWMGSEIPELWNRETSNRGVNTELTREPTYSPVIQHVFIFSKPHHRLFN